MNNSAQQILVIESINRVGQSVMKIFLPDGTVEFYLILEYTPTRSSSVESIDFLTIKGIELTQFMAKNNLVFADTGTSFNTALQSYMMGGKIVQRKIQRDIPWMLYLAE